MLIIIIIIIMVQYLLACKAIRPRVYCVRACMHVSVCLSVCLSGFCLSAWLAGWLAGWLVGCLEKMAGNTEKESGRERGKGRGEADRDRQTDGQLDRQYIQTTETKGSFRQNKYQSMLIIIHRFIRIIVCRFGISIICSLCAMLHESKLCVSLIRLQSCLSAALLL